MSLEAQIKTDLTEAMKAKDADRLSTLRMVKANLMNRRIEKGSDLTDDEITKALQSLVKQRRDSIEQYENAGRTELAAKEALEISHIEVYLPQAATPEELDEAARKAEEVYQKATAGEDFGRLAVAYSNSQTAL